jgi:hypothetical protein
VKARLKVGDLVKNIHALDPAGMGIIIEISKPQLMTLTLAPTENIGLNNR